MTTTTWIVLTIGLVLVVGLVRIYNRLVELRNRIANAFGQIDVQLKRRGCAEFCVNGLLAGDCRLVRSCNEQEETRRT